MKDRFMITKAADSFGRTLVFALAAVLSATWALAPASAQEATHANGVTEGVIKGADPLPSWNEGATKQAILSFVKEATDKNSSHFIAPEDRIATFDNDGTLWCEMPVVELAFTLDLLKAMAKEDPALKQKQPFKAALEGDHAYFDEAGMKAVLELVIATHGNTSQEEFEKEASAFFKSAKHPKYGVRFPETAYQPMVELLRYLRANGFQTWICSGGWMDLMRMMSREAYGIPRQQVIGSRLNEKWLEKSGRQMLWILPELGSLCDHAGKPVNIDLHIGKRPVFAAGNVRTGGDIDMLSYCQSRPGPSFQLMVNHDDAEREFAYAEKNGASLKASREHGWVVVSIKNDWKRVFSFSK